MKKTMLLLLCLFIFSLSADEFDDFEQEFRIKSAKANAKDPLESYNKRVHAFNVSSYNKILKPSFKIYEKIFPYFLRKALYNFYENSGAPLRIVNNLLQLKLKNTVREFARFSFNTVFSLGLIDISGKYTNLGYHDADFGSTLGYWGVGTGSYLVLPVMGSYNLRELLTMPIDLLLDPFVLINPWLLSSGVKIAFKFNEIEYNKKQIDNILLNSIDSYKFVKDYYMHEREEMIKE